MSQKTLNSDFSAKDIVSDIQNQLKSSSELYDQYIDSNATQIVDPVTNTEFLKKGWSENLIHNDTIVKSVQDRFSFVIDLTDAQELIMTAALRGNDIYLQPVTMTLKIENETMEPVTLHYNYFSKYTFVIPKKFRNASILIEGFLQKMSPSVEVIIRSLHAVRSNILSDPIRSSFFELENMKRDTNQLIQVLEWHKNPELLLPAGNNSDKKKIIKKVAKRLFWPFFKVIFDRILFKRFVLKAIRPFTTAQIQYNQYLLEIISLQAKRNDKMEELLVSALKVGKKRNNETDSSIR